MISSQKVGVRKHQLNSVGNVHKWRPTFFGHFLPTYTYHVRRYLSCNVQYLGGFFESPTYPNCIVHYLLMDIPFVPQINLHTRGYELWWKSSKTLILIAVMSKTKPYGFENSNSVNTSESLSSRRWHQTLVRMIGYFSIHSFDWIIQVKHCQSPK